MSVPKAKHLIPELPQIEICGVKFSAAILCEDPDQYKIALFDLMRDENYIRQSNIYNEAVVSLVSMRARLKKLINGKEIIHDETVLPSPASIDKSDKRNAKRIESLEKEINKYEVLINRKRRKIRSKDTSVEDAGKLVVEIENDEINLSELKHNLALLSDEYAESHAEYIIRREGLSAQRETCMKTLEDDIKNAEKREHDSEIAIKKMIRERIVPIVDTCSRNMSLICMYPDGGKEFMEQIKANCPNYKKTEWSISRRGDISFSAISCVLTKDLDQPMICAAARLADMKNTSFIDAYEVLVHLDEINRLFYYKRMRDGSYVCVRWPREQQPA